MIKQHGSPSEWQKATTLVWISKLLREYKDNDFILFEGQVNLDYIREGFANHNFSNYKMILVHCNNNVRHKRLKDERNQPELINPEMDNWANFLMKQALEQNALILDTSDKNLDQLIEWCKSNLDL
jgi:hypothetical protein